MDTDDVQRLLGQLESKLEAAIDEVESTRRRLEEHAEVDERRWAEVVTQMQKMHAENAARMDHVDKDLSRLKVEKRLVLALVLLVIPALGWFLRWSITDVLVQQGIVEIRRRQ